MDSPVQPAPLRLDGTTSFKCGEICNYTHKVAVFSTLCFQRVYFENGTTSKRSFNKSKFLIISPNGLREMLFCILMNARM